MWVRRHFTHHLRPSSLLMPSKHARKKPVKARGLKEAAAKQATPKLSARKGKHAAQGKENHPSGMAAPVSAASSVLTSAPISVSTDGGSTTEDARVECPKKIKNLEVAMSLSNHSTYRELCVSPSSFLLSVSELNIIFIIEQHKEIRRDGGSQF